jgi:tetraacyldisaccharide 4'-kinase
VIPLPLPALAAASRLYGQAALWRRRRAARRPGLRRRLEAPVVSVGNLALGGRGKSPTVAHLARLLLERGERPAVLSRGYARAHRPEGPVVVRTADAVVAGVETAGDEPLMLARQLPGAVLVVHEDRYLAGRLAESRLGATVHLLDDGFQHHRVARDVDLLLVTAEDVTSGRVVPAGRLREPVSAAAAADAWIAAGGEVSEIERVAAGLGVTRVFRLRREVRVPRMVDPAGSPPRQPRSAPVLACAGIAGPERFFDDLAGAGWNVVERVVFPDHHRYTARDLAAVSERARAAGAVLVLTTEKDLVRMDPTHVGSLPLAWVPLEVEVEPAGDFLAFLLGRLAAARDARRRSGPAGPPAGGAHGA